MRIATVSVPMSARRYSREPEDKRAYSERFKRLYSRLARPYDLGVKLFPVWRRWLGHALPHIEGPRVLEVSPGTGWLLTQYAGSFEVSAVDLSPEMVEVSRSNVHRARLTADIRVGDVEALPYADASFDTVLSTMAFSGYPDGRRALGEMTRVLRPGGRLVIVDVNYPSSGNRLGTALVELWKRSGDLIRDMLALFAELGLDATDREVGGFGSIHLYLAKKGDSGATASASMPQSSRRSSVTSSAGP